MESEPKRQFKVKVFAYNGIVGVWALNEVVECERYICDNGMHKFINDVRQKDDTWQQILVMAVPINSSIIKEKIK